SEVRILFSCNLYFCIHELIFIPCTSIFIINIYNELIVLDIILAAGFRYLDRLSFSDINEFIYIHAREKSEHTSKKKNDEPGMVYVGTPSGEPAFFMQMMIIICFMLITFFLQIFNDTVSIRSILLMQI